MNKYLCPRCGTYLRESVWEKVIEMSDGSFKLDVHPIYECQDENCGYMKRSEPVPEIIAQQGDDRLLLLYQNDRGRILDIKANVIWPEIHYESILARGYWDKYKGNHDVEILLENVRDSEAAYIDTPNLFDFATSELSQDAFLCWLMSWSQETHRSLDKPLHDAAVDFVSMIFNVNGYPVPTIEKIDIIRQFQALDILAIVNGKYAILIEDKTYTKNHSNQLKRYREAVTATHPDMIQLPIYYKIADQSNYLSVIDAKYFPFTRKRMLQILRRGKSNGVNHPIFLDYLTHLEKLDSKINAYKTKPVIDWDGFSWQGFYMELQKHFKGNWDYVPNKRGGFWGFWWKPQSNKNYYLQLEQQLLCVKIEAEGVQDLKEFQTEEMVNVLLESEDQGLHLQKPTRMSTGKTMTIAHRPNYIQTKENGLLDLDKTIEELKKWELKPSSQDN
jgi:hypothetical protein